MCGAAHGDLGASSDSIVKPDYMQYFLRAFSHVDSTWVEPAGGNRRVRLRDFSCHATCQHQEDEKHGT